MTVFPLFGCMLYLLHLTSAQFNFQGLLIQGTPCFKVIKTPGCNKTLADSYEPESPNVGGNIPRTWAFLFGQKNPEVGEPLHNCGGRLPPDSSFNPSFKTIVIIHGWLDGVCRTAWMREMKEQFFKKGNYNIILIDWTWGNTLDYFLASQNCKIVGEQCGFIINNIMAQTGIGAEKFSVIGHSFGAIASGFCGRKVNGTLSRISALDPALGPFKNAPPEGRVTYKDAQVVDVIHSNGGNCSIFTIGDSRQLGHADFYPNGGTVQFSCYYYMFKAFLKGDLLYAIASLVPQLCYHLQAIQFYRVSINPEGCEFIGVESSSYREFLSKSSRSGNQTTAIMGLDYEMIHRNDGIRRKYYLKTRFACPYTDYSYLTDNEVPSKCQKRKKIFPLNLNG